MSEQDYRPLRDQAAEWITRAGSLARERFGSAVASRKPDRSYVTDADHAVQALLLAAIAECCPGDAAITEETQVDPDRHASAAAARRCWVIDPIDGTRSYARGLPGFSVAVALLEGGWPVLGLIHNPLTGQTYSAWKGGGAWLDGKKLQVSDPAPAGEMLLAIPSSSSRGLPAVVHRWIDRMVVRNLGSTALHIALVASGALDAMYADECHLWDLAAGEIILREAGGQLLSPRGQPYFPMNLANFNDPQMPFLAAGPRMLQRMLLEFQQG